MNHDIRWLQRFDHYSKALNELQEAIDLFKKRDLSKLEKQGLIQCFEYTHELAWKTLKDFLENQGFIDLIGPKDVIRQAVKLRVLAQGEIWLNMIESRRRISHVYDEKVVEEIVGLISKVYFSEFVSLNGKLNELKISS